MLSLLLCFSACQKLELGDEENKGSNENGGGTVNPPKDDDDENANCDTLSIMEALSLPKNKIDTEVILKGYIVGYIKGTGLNSATFALPENAPNTNMLLADSPQEKLAANCLLSRATQGRLYDNKRKTPISLIIRKFIHKRIATYGAITTYFNRQRHQEHLGL